jgi:hypothetical protein
VFVLVAWASVVVFSSDGLSCSFAGVGFGSLGCRRFSSVVS